MSLGRHGIVVAGLLMLGLTTAEGAPSPRFGLSLLQGRAACLQVFFVIDNPGI
jgi:hypothetical protein